MKAYGLRRLLGRGIAGLLVLALALTLAGGTSREGARAQEEAQEESVSVTLYEVTGRVATAGAQQVRVIATNTGEEEALLRIYLYDGETDEDGHYLNMAKASLVQESEGETSETEYASTVVSVFGISGLCELEITEQEDEVSRYLELTLPAGCEVDFLLELVLSEEETVVFVPVLVEGFASRTLSEGFVLVAAEEKEAIETLGISLEIEEGSLRIDAGEAEVLLCLQDEEGRTLCLTEKEEGYELSEEGGTWLRVTGQLWVYGLSETTYQVLIYDLAQESGTKGSAVLTWTEQGWSVENLETEKEAVKGGVSGIAQQLEEDEAEETADVSEEAAQEEETEPVILAGEVAGLLIRAVNASGRAAQGVVLISSLSGSAEGLLYGEELCVEVILPDGEIWSLVEGEDYALFYSAQEVLAEETQEEELVWSSEAEAALSLQIALAETVILPAGSELQVSVLVESAQESADGLLRNTVVVLCGEDETVYCSCQQVFTAAVISEEDLEATGEETEVPEASSEAAQEEVPESAETATTEEETETTTETSVETTEEETTEAVVETTTETSAETTEEETTKAVIESITEAVTDAADDASAEEGGEDVTEEEAKITSEAFAGEAGALTETTEEVAEEDATGTSALEESVNEERETEIETASAEENETASSETEETTAVSRGADTGDHSAAGMWLALAVVALIAIVAGIGVKLWLSSRS